MKRIEFLQNIDTNTPEGRLLMAALACITVKVHPDKTPNECIAILNEDADEMFSREQPPIIFGDPVLQRRG